MAERAVLLGLLAMGMLTAMCVINGGPMIEANIRDRSIFAAAALGVGPTMVHVTGRNVTLQGDIKLADRLRNAEKAIAALPGVRNVVVVIDTTNQTVNERIINRRDTPSEALVGRDLDDAVGGAVATRQTDVRLAGENQ